MSLLDRLLPEPSFVTRDPQTVTQELITLYESLTGKTLYPAQVERLLVDLISYRESLMRDALQDAAKLNLVRYSRAPVLDYLGENIGVARLDATRAAATFRFNFDPAPSSATLLPAGTEIEGGSVSFVTTDDAYVQAGSLSIDLYAECSVEGVTGNGFVAGQIKTLSSEIAGLSVSGVANIDVSAGGADSESDDHYRERIVLAPEQFSNAGSVGAYRYHALSASQEIIDVAIVSPTPGVINLHPLVKTGLPSTAVKNAVYKACNADDKRPLTDQVSVLDPVIVDYTITAQLTVYSYADASVALAEAIKAAEAYKIRMQSALGKDIIRDEQIAALKVYGVYSVGLVGTDTELSDESWARCTAINITVADVKKG
jgi:phage-related baseplate assembly protein